MSLLVHEYGHALTAVYFGANPTVHLEAFGGNAQYNSYGMSSKQQFFITLNGPLLESFLIALPYFLLKSEVFVSHPYIQYFLYVTMRLNILWCLLNLIPILPLDGGHLLSYILEKRFGPKGYKLSIIIGLVCTVVAVPYLYFQGFFFFGTLILIFGFQNFQTLKKDKSFSKESHFSFYLKAIDAMDNHETEKAKMILKKLLKVKDEKIKHLAIESLAKAYFQENKIEKSYTLLLKADLTLLKEGKCLLCKLAFEKQNYELVHKYSRDIYNIEPSHEIAVLNSKACARLNKPELSGAWLETASKFGADSRKRIKDLLQDQIYDLVKDQKMFKKHVGKIF